MAPRLQATAANSSDITLPFDLAKDPDQFYTVQANRALASVFTGTQGFSLNNVFLVFHLDELPPKPWAKTVAGVPCYLTTNQADTGPLKHFLKRFTRNGLSIMANIDARGSKLGSNNVTFDANVKEVFEYFREVGIAVQGLQNWNDFLVIVLDSKDQMNHPKMPRHIMHLGCYLISKEDVKFEHEPALCREGPDIDEPGLAPIKLAPIRSITYGQFVSMKNPYMGVVDGVILATEYKEHSLVEDKYLSFWISASNWVWTGQDSSDIVRDGICGTPLTSQDADVLGFFQCVGAGDMKDFAYFTAAQNIIERDYEFVMKQDSDRHESTADN